MAKAATRTKTAQHAPASDLRAKIEAAIMALPILPSRRADVPAHVAEIEQAIFRFQVRKPASWWHPTPLQAKKELRAYANAIDAGQDREAAWSKLSDDTRELVEEWRWQRTLPAAWSPPLRGINDEAEAARYIARRVGAGRARGRKIEPGLPSLGRQLAVVYRMLVGKKKPTKDREPDEAPKRVIDADGRHGGPFADFVAAIIAAGDLKGVTVGRIVDDVTGHNERRKAKKKAKPTV